MSTQYFIVITLAYPGVPEKLSEDDQVSRVKCETHVSCSDGQYGHTRTGRVLELLTQLLPLS